MNVTFILRDFDDSFFNGFGSQIKGLLNMSDAEKFKHLNKLVQDGLVTVKIGTGQFNDRVELNSIMRGDVRFDFSLSPRRGYKLATFSISKTTVDPPNNYRSSSNAA